MIDWTKATKAELDELRSALIASEIRLERKSLDHENASQRSGAMWRLYIVNELLRQIDNR